MSRHRLPHVWRHPVNLRHDSRTTGEKIADSVAEHIGSWRFLIIQTVAVAVWVGLNITGIWLRWDPFPFILLNLLFSVQAAYTGPVLLLSQNRQGARDRDMAEHDYETNQVAEKNTERILADLTRNTEATLAIVKHLEIEVAKH